MFDFGPRSIIFIIMCIILFISKNYRGILYNKIKYFFTKYSKESLPKGNNADIKWAPPEGKTDLSEVPPTELEQMDLEDPNNLFPPPSAEQIAADEAINNMTQAELRGDEFSEDFAYEVHEIQSPRVLRKKRKLIPADLRSGMIGACCGLVLDRVVKLLETYVPLFIDKFME